MNQEQQINNANVSLTQEEYSHLMAFLRSSTNQNVAPSANQVQSTITSESDNTLLKISGKSLCSSSFNFVKPNKSEAPWVLDTYRGNISYDMYPFIPLLYQS